MRFKTAAIFLSVFFASVGHAATDLAFILTASSDQKSISFVLSGSESIDGCDVEVFASGARTVSPASTSIATTSAGTSALTLNATKLKALRKVGSHSRRRVYFIAQATCGESKSLSNTASVSLRLKSFSGVSSLAKWLRRLKTRLLVGNLTMTQAFSGQTFSQPVDIQNAKDGSGRIFVAEQSGKIFVLSSAEAGTKDEFIDLSSKLDSSAAERGLLGITFHPDYADNGYFFVNYSRKSDGATVIARYQASPPISNQANIATELVILVVEQPFANHNGGQLAFGPDGYLYIGMGDGGSAGDPNGNGQDRSGLLGDMLRIDVDQSSTGKNYSIPSSNPHVGNTSGIREEIFASGFRNPWRFCFDPKNGDLWAGDVGQGAREEIDLVESGKNYGWNITEGTLCYNPSSGCDRTGLTEPVFDYARSVGQSITGGYVYRGSELPGLVGKYIYADFIQGKIWVLFKNGARYSSLLLFDTSMLISTFGQDQAKNLYFASYSDGKIFKLTS